LNKYELDIIYGDDTIDWQCGRDPWDKPKELSELARRKTKGCRTGRLQMKGTWERLSMFKEMGCEPGKK